MPGCLGYLKNEKLTMLAVTDSTVNRTQVKANFLAKPLFGTESVYYRAVTIESDFSISLQNRIKSLTLGKAEAYINSVILRKLCKMVV